MLCTAHRGVSGIDVELSLPVAGGSSPDFSGSLGDEVLLGRELV